MSKIGRQIRVKRYWPGKAPDWADEAEEETVLRTPSSKRSRVSFEQAFPYDDSRLRRLAEIRTVDRDEIRADHRRIRQAEVVSTAANEDTEEDEDAVEEKRRRIRERLLNLRRQVERELPTEEERLLKLQNCSH